MVRTGINLNKNQCIFIRCNNPELCIFDATHS